MNRTICVATLGAFTASAWGQTRFETFTLPQATGMNAVGIGAAGDRVAFTAIFDGSPHGYVWDLTTGLSTPVAAPMGRPFNPARDLSNNGHVAVGFAFDINAAAHAYRNDEDLGVPPPWLESVANGTNGDGTVVVGELTGEKGEPAQGFRWDSTGGGDGVFTVLGGTGPADVTVAHAVSADGSTTAGVVRIAQSDGTFIHRAAVWSADATEPALLPLLPGGTFSEAFALSADGRHVAGYGDSTSGVVGFLHDRNSGEFRIFDALDGNDSSAATDVNADGTAVVGYSTGGVAQTRVWFWHTNHAVQDLAAYFEARGVGMAGRAFPAQEYSVSDDGHTIAGTFVDATEAVFAAQICFADFDLNGFLNGIDFGEFVRAFEAGEARADFDDSGFINGIDFDLFVQEFEAGCGRW